MTATDTNGAAAGMSSSVADLIRFAAELQRPALIDPTTLAAATKPAFPSLDGVRPGFGVQRPNPWGLGCELRGEESPHWTAANHSPRTFGHFGQAGTFVWIDPQGPVGVVALTDRNAGKWAAEAWPVFSDAILEELQG